MHVCFLKSIMHACLFLKSIMHVHSMTFSNSYMGANSFKGFHNCEGHFYLAKYV
jgi:hypothetical protein